MSRAAPPLYSNNMHYKKQATKAPEKPTTHTTQKDKKEKKKRERRKTKNTGAGQSLGEGADVEVRVEVGVRGHEADTLGETQTPNGVWVSPAPEKEKERKKNVVGEQTKQTKKEGGHKHQGKQGAGLEGHHTKQHLNPEDHETHTRNHTNTREPPNKKDKHQADRASGELSQQGGGAHGPPCAF